MDRKTHKHFAYLNNVRHTKSSEHVFILPKSKLSESQTCTREPFEETKPTISKINTIEDTSSMLCFRILVLAKRTSSDRPRTAVDDDPACLFVHFFCLSIMICHSQWHAFCLSTRELSFHGRLIRKKSDECASVTHSLHFNSLGVPYLSVTPLQTPEGKPQIIGSCLDGGSC